MLYVMVRYVMDFSESIKLIRRKSFMSQERFAEKLGVSYSTVNRWENGKTLPNYATMKLIDSFCKKHSISFDVSDNTWGDEQ